MTILLNGEEHDTNVQTVSALLRELQVPRHGIAVAVDGNVIRKDEHESTILNERAEIEIIRAVQGG